MPIKDSIDNIISSDSSLQIIRERQNGGLIYISLLDNCFYFGFNKRKIEKCGDCVVNCTIEERIIKSFFTQDINFLNTKNQDMISLVLKLQKKPNSKFMFFIVEYIKKNKMKILTVVKKALLKNNDIVLESSLSSSENIKIACCCFKTPACSPRKLLGEIFNTIDPKEILPVFLFSRKI